MMNGGGGESTDMTQPMSPYPLLQNVGDVVDMRMKPGPFQGPTSQSVDYFMGRTQNPKVQSIDPSPQFWADWANRMKNRNLIEQMGGLRG